MKNSHNLFSIGFVLVSLTIIDQTSVTSAAESLDNDFESGTLYPWTEQSNLGIKWKIENRNSPWEPENVAPLPSNGMNYLRVDRGTSLAFGVAILRSQVFKIPAGSRNTSFSFSFWIRSKWPQFTNLELYLNKNGNEDLLLNLYEYSYVDNQVWRQSETVTIADDTSSDLTLVFYAYCGTAPEDAVAIDDLYFSSPTILTTTASTTTLSTKPNTLTTSSYGTESTSSTVPTTTPLPTETTTSSAITTQTRRPTLTMTRSEEITTTTTSTTTTPSTTTPSTTTTSTTTTSATTPSTTTSTTTTPSTTTPSTTTPSTTTTSTTTPSATTPSTTTSTTTTPSTTTPSTTTTSTTTPSTTTTSATTPSTTTPSTTTPSTTTPSSSIGTEEISTITTELTLTTLAEEKCPDFLQNDTDVPCWTIDTKCYCFYKGSTPQNWTESDWFCRGGSMTLLTIETKEEDELIFDYVSSFTEIPNTVYWTAGRFSQEGNDRWEWASNAPFDPFSYDNWFVGEPNGNNTMGEYCAYLTFSANFSAGYWVDDTCGSRGFKFICEKND